VVHARADRLAHAAVQDDLRLRATVLAGLLEIEDDKLEFEATPKTLPEYYDPESGKYCVIVDAVGKTVIRSPSTGDEPLAVTAPWERGRFTFHELEAGPHGTPCAVATYSFAVEVERDEDTQAEPAPHPEAVGAAAAPEPPGERRFQILVALDSRPRDGSLADLRGFLVVTSLLAVGATVLGGLFLARTMLRPIERMTRTATTLTPEDPTRRLDPATVVTELHSLSTTLNGALDRLGDALERERRFTSDASHELRTPVSVILSNSELLMRRSRSAEATRTGVERIHRVARHMRDVIENLLTLARADAASTAPRRERVDLAHLVEVVCEDVVPLAVRAELELRTDVADGTMVDGDPRQLTQLVQNLLSNAVKFTPAGGRVDVTVRPEGEEAVLTVADTGDGIERDHLDRIFDRFYRVREGSDQREGAGLGLAIVQWVVRAHGGTIRIDSRVGAGSTFEVRLPSHEGAADRPRRPPPHPGETRSAVSPAGDARGRTIEPKEKEDA
jgi:heavy metal sensor kinase